ncbi:uncharacterized protein TNCV_1696461 [Trichonephila clavipes]|nr:uncharacterized protein TNCV_1696461 [Trichonephila clavipes]
MRHVKYPWSARLAWDLGDIKFLVWFHIVRAQVPPCGEETMRQNDSRRLKCTDAFVFCRELKFVSKSCITFSLIAIQMSEQFFVIAMAAVAEWYRYRTVACFVTDSSPVPLKTRRVGQRCTLNLSRAETSSRWCGVVVRTGGASSGVVHVT